MRVHDLSSGEAGTILALQVGLLGGAGTFLGGWLADRLSVRSEGYRAWVISAAAVIYAPFAWLAYNTADATLSVWAFVVPAMVGGVYIGSGFAIIQNNTPVEMRSVAAAVNLFILNIVGLGLGPTTVGVISDIYASELGDSSLRVGMTAMIGVMLWGAAHYAYAGWRLHTRTAAV